ncbi:hypothetical protein [Streptomyces sp. NPDC050485]|uniref:hypothetical protein n=1 Tax=Streptomyces sp. NPDC050485 TaxID=3365617 RepID=UPI0037ADD1C3
MLSEGEWNLVYGPSGLHPGADFVFGTTASGYYLLEPYEIAYGDTDTGDTPLPQADGVRLGRDYRAAATLTFEIGVDSVDSASDQPGRHGHNLAALSDMGRVWDAEAVRGRFGVPAVLRTVQGGRCRRFYGRPRKWAPAGSRLTRQGYTPVVTTFACVDGVAYDDVEKSVRVDLNPPPHRGLAGPLRTPLTMTGESTAKTSVAAVVEGTKPAWPVITIYGPISQPSCEVVLRDDEQLWNGGQRGWRVSLDRKLRDGEWITIDPRPWARTVLLNNGGSVAGALSRDTPRMQNMQLPLGRHDLVLRGVDATGSSFMTVAWRDAYTYL